MGNCCCGCKKWNKHVRFNVGGAKFDTTFGTVTRRGKDRTNLLALMVTKRWCCRRRRGLKRLTTIYSNAETFIDRDGTHFRHILNWLRDGDGVVPELDAASYRALLKEAEYYRLDKMVKAIWEGLEFRDRVRDLGFSFLGFGVPLLPYLFLPPAII
ncbi:FH protein interacting protein FIP2 [Physcomitrium patens]|uniref:FH protein interacting protein FIP2 n=1 Tax=Physcomitrium patens TaxID=3218 RepID=UPI000D15E1F4|nr:FH protein interacting protein FIP2-like [Physcomitrium patens]|eukprot:XP_024360668.1 FH protein interacting protein FIP2-like [Physcomitrella patens]